MTKPRKEIQTVEDRQKIRQDFNNGRLARWRAFFNSLTDEEYRHHYGPRPMSETLKDIEWTDDHE